MATVAPPLIPFAHWTPTEIWLGCELARRSLVARIDGAPPCSAALAQEGEGADLFWIEGINQGEEATLALHLRGELALVSLEPSTTAKNRWRRDWVVELWRSATERWVLTPGEPPVAISDAGRGPVWGRLLTRRRFLLLQNGESAFRVRLEDRAFYRNTKQSSALPLTILHSLAWSPPTLPEAAPYWQIDLGHSYYLSDLALDLAAVPAGATLRVQGCALLAPTGEMPPGALTIEPVLADSADGSQKILRIESPLGWVARFVRVELRAREGVPVSLVVAGCELPGVELFGDSLRVTWGRTLALFRDRVMFAAREGDEGPFVPAMSYGEVARQAGALARGLAYFLEDSGPCPAGSDPATDRIFLALATRNRPEWIMADLAAIERGYVLVPLSPEEPEERLASILARCRPAAMLVEQADAARLGALVTRVCPSLTLLVVCGSPEEGPSPPDTATCGDTSVGEDFDESGQDESPLQVRFEDLVWQGKTRGSTPPPVPRTEEDLYSLLFTSGSTGAPKGAMRSYASFHGMLMTYGVPQPAFHLSFQPLSHLSERMYLPAVFVHGGTVAFSRGGAFLMEELRSFAPTVLGSVPRLFDLLHAKYQRRLRAAEALSAEGTARVELAEQAAAREAREAFGSRLMALSVGSAPVSPEVLAFLRHVFADIWVLEGYGTTEVGSIAGNGQVSPRVKVKLVPIAGEDLPRSHPEALQCGEIWVWSPHTISGYFGEPEATAASRDDEGFFRTGDLGERLADGTIKVVGRLKNAVKLAQGEFVSAERIEAALSAAPLVDRIFVLAEPGASAASALVFPDREALASLLGAPPSAPARSLSAQVVSPSVVPGDSLSTQAHEASLSEEPLSVLVEREGAAEAVLAALCEHGLKAGLASYELPRTVVLDATPLSVAGGLLTASGKLARAALTARLTARLAAAHAPSGEGKGQEVRGEEMSPLAIGVSAGEKGQTQALIAALTRAAAVALGRPVTASEPIVAALDSLATAALLSALAEELGSSIPLPLWFASVSLADLAARLLSRSPIVAEPALVSAAMRDLAEPLGFAPWKDTKPIPIKTVLLTGATGFLGVHLVESLLARTPFEILCLVRAEDDERASARLRGVMQQHGVADSPRVRVIAGDLSAPLFGLSEGSFAALAARVDALLHAGAEVSWLAPYASLRGANVTGTRTVLQLAALGRPRPVHFVSTISTAPAEGEEDSFLKLEQSSLGSPYALSKWVAEYHTQRAADAGLPVATYRPAMIAPHSQRGLANPKDFLHRYLTGCRDLGLYLDLPGERLDMTPVDFVADAIVALLVAAPFSRETYHLVNIEQSLSYAAIGRALSLAGVPVKPASYPAFRAALLAEKGPKGGELRALASFFPAAGFGLHMGPWPSSRTRHRLARLGVRCPVIDAAYVRRLVGR